MSEPVGMTAARSRASQVAQVLRNETIGGVLLLLAAALAMIIANSPWSTSYFNLANTVVGPHFAHLDLTVSQWAADGLLAVFFFVAGLELKAEFVSGSLRQFSTAIVPATAAVGGMLIPALIYVLINVTADGGEPSGWGIPMATDIAFALAVLAVAGRQLPAQVRVFLLTLAVVDDLGAIIVIAVFYSHGFDLLPFLGAAAVLAAYWLAQRQRIRGWWVYVPLALLAWLLMHASGIHATIAGVALGLLTRATCDEDEEHPPVDAYAHTIHPWSAGLCVPLFAFFAAGVSLAGKSLSSLLHSPIALGITIGLVAGKPVGIFVASKVLTKLSRASLDEAIGWRDIGAVGLVSGVGFTVSLLICELAFVDNESLLTDAKLGVLAGSLISALLAAIWLHRRGRAHAGAGATDLSAG